MCKRKTTAQFIEEAKAVHGDRYDYSKVVYRGVDNKVEIVCEKHGAFQKRARYHTNGSGCDKCRLESVSKKMTKTTEWFVKRAREVHGDKYHYKESEYESSSKKIKIYCKAHGFFDQTANDHLRGSGCPKCAPSYKMNTHVFIEKAIEIHGNKYSYTNVKYINSRTKVDIFCEKHGSFMQSPDCHLQGRGCYKCGRDSSLNKRRKGGERFIEEARKKHGDKYNYELINYINNHTKIKIICKIHGIFKQSPRRHIKGDGCPNCSRNKKLDTKTFIEKSKLIHGDKFDYTKVSYINNRIKVKIICKKHGVFKQAPASHLGGSGCDKCAIEYRGSLNRKSFEYFIKEARSTHGDKYDYRFVVLGHKLKSKVKIICSKHGEFQQSAAGHIQGRGCPRCGKKNMAKKRSLGTDVFIRKSKEIHGTKYGYKNVEYKNINKKVIITCEKHGDFSQSPGGHLSGQGCPKCGYEETVRKITSKKALTIISEFNDVHNGFYSYEQAIYINNNTKIEITCPKHGNFSQSPSNHRRGAGCPKCGKDRGIEKRRKLTTKTFVERSIEKYGNIYDYEKTVFKGLEKSVLIFCKEHNGFFKQKACNHLYGNGCQVCKESRGEREIRVALSKMGICFERQKSFESCRSILPLYFDFYLRKYDILIEYDGIQHYQIVDNNFFGGEKALKKRQKRDAIKTQWAKENGYKLIRIPYWDFDNIEQILKEEILGEKKRFIPIQLSLFA